MKLKEICNQLNIPYDNAHGTRIYDRLCRDYLITKDKNDYTLVRPLTESEKLNVIKITKCADLLKDTIYYVLSQQTNNVVTANTKQLLELFNIVNKNYKYFTYSNLTSDKLQILSNSIDPNIDNLNYCDFVDDVHPILSRLLKNTLKRMENELTIRVTKHLMIGEHDIVTKEGIIHKPNRRATNDEIEELLRLSKIYMNEKGLNDWSRLNLYQKREINRKVCRDMNIAYTYNEYEILLNRQGIETEVNKMKELNEEVVLKLLTTQAGDLKNLSQEIRKKDVDFLIRT